jgi:hypothetical protein
MLNFGRKYAAEEGAAGASSNEKDSASHGQLAVDDSYRIAQLLC